MSRYVTAADGKEGFVPYVYCAPQGTAITDDIHVGARSTYLTNGSAHQQPAAGATTRRDKNKHGGGGNTGGGGGGGSQHNQPTSAANNTRHGANNNSIRTSPKSQPNQVKVHNNSTYYNSFNKQAPAPAHNNSTASAPPSGNLNRANTSTMPSVKNTSMNHTYTQVQTNKPNMTNSFTRGAMYNSSRSSNNRDNSGRNNSNGHSDTEDYLSMDNRSRYGRFHNHRYENVNVRNGFRNQGHVRHSSEDRSYGQHRQPQAAHTRYHSLDRSGYGGYNREYRPLANGSRNHQGRQRHSSQDAYSQRGRQRSHSRDSHNSSNVQGYQGQGRLNNSRTVQGHSVHHAQSVNGPTHSNNTRTTNTPHHASSNNPYNQAGHARSQGPSQGQGQRLNQGHNRGQQELDSVGSWGDQDRSSASDTPLLDTSEVSSFVKRPHGRYIVLFPFTGQVYNIIIM